MKELQSFLDKSFKGSSRKRLEELISPIKAGATIPSGTLVIMASGDTKLRLKILEKDTPNKGFSTPLALNEMAQKLGITPNYLHWYLSYDEIEKILIAHATGTVFLRIPKTIITKIPVPIPANISRNQTTTEKVMTREKNEFKDFMNSYYEDYRVNLKNQKYRTAIILAGVMSEAIIYQLLLDEGVNKKILDDDRSLGLGKLIVYLKLLKLDKTLDLPITHFVEVQKLRNLAVHFGSMRNKSATFCENNLKSFDQIIKFFGI